MFSATRHRGAHQRILGALAREITLKVHNGSAYDDYTVRARVFKIEERDLVEGGPLELGDLRLIILADTLPKGLRQLNQRDLVQIDGNLQAIMKWDTYSRVVGGELLAVEAVVRGET